ncbi:hypothetical protein [Spirosoma harenae]
MRNRYNSLLSSLLFVAVFAACSRPVAYFQPTAREHFTSTKAPATPPAITAPITTETPTQEAVNATAEPTAQIAQATAAMDQLDALARNDSKLANNKALQKRLSRIRTMLATTNTTDKLAATNATESKKMNLVERMMVKKLNKKISKQLAPANPEKAMVSTGTLATGAVFVIVGLLLVLLTTGTAFTIGLIALLVGAVVLLVGLL